MGAKNLNLKRGLLLEEHSKMEIKMAGFAEHSPDREQLRGAEHHGLKKGTVLQEYETLVQIYVEAKKI